MKRLLRASRVFQRRGLGYFGYLVTGYLLPKLIYAALSRVAPHRLRKIAQLLILSVAALVFSLVGVWLDWLSAAALIALSGAAAWLALLLLRRLRIASMQSRARRLLEQAPSMPFTAWNDWPVDASLRQAVETHLHTHPAEEVLLGQIDNEGRVWGQFGNLPGWINISKEQFVPRARFPLDIVLLDGKVLVRKDFRRDRGRFIREWHNLAALMGKANVPAVYRADEDRCILYKNLIVGKNVNDVLVAAGAQIHNIQTDNDPELAHLNGEARLYAILARGTALLPECFPESLFLQMEDQMDAIHRCGVAGLSLTFGNIMVDAQSHPWFIDLEGAHCHHSTVTPLFLWRRDQDRVKFNRIYNKRLVTEAGARAELVRIAASGPGWYAPIDFGSGLAVDGFWTVDSGTGRWEFLNRQVLKPLIAGKRVLDLGSNNGLMPIMMLKDGAREVVGLELDPEMVARARVIQRIFEWRDMRKYPLTIHTCDMRAVLDTDFGSFDIITAFCSLYYLTEEDMARVVRRAAELVPVMVLQAKVDTRPEAGDNKAVKSSILFLKRLLEENGFPKVETHAPKDFSRPLLVGKQTQPLYWA